jgi:hypothetical protein
MALVGRQGAMNPGGNGMGRSIGREAKRVNAGDGAAFVQLDALKVPPKTIAGPYHELLQSPTSIQVTPAT